MSSLEQMVPVLPWDSVASEISQRALPRKLEKSTTKSCSNLLIRESVRSFVLGSEKLSVWLYDAIDHCEFLFLIHWWLDAGHCVWRPSMELGEGEPMDSLSESNMELLLHAAGLEVKSLLIMSYPGCTSWTLFCGSVYYICTIHMWWPLPDKGYYNNNNNNNNRLFYLFLCRHHLTCRSMPIDTWMK